MASEVRKGSTVGRPQTLYSADRSRARRGPRLPAARRHPGRAGHRRRATAASARRSSPANGAPTWSDGAAQAGRPAPPARTSRCSRRRSPEPASTRASVAAAPGRVEITLRDCPFRDLLDEHRELVCAVHRGLLEGMLAASAALALRAFEPLAESTVCRLVAGAAEPPRTGRATQ